MEDMCRLSVMWLATAIDTLFGNSDGLFFTLIIVMTLDYITGVCAAFINKQLSSRIGAKGLTKKIGILCAISLTVLIERNIMNTTGLRSAVILYYISNEGISIFENLTKLGIPIPRKIRDVLYNIKDSEDQ